jgi:predicted outer membrane protein
MTPSQEIMMHKLRTTLAAAIILALALPTAAVAQDRHAVPAAALAQTVTAGVAAQDADRAAIREAIARPEVRQLAATVGVDLEGVAASIDSLSPESLARASAAAKDVNDTLVGGASTIVISTTTIIIVLLLVILIVVVAS